MYMSPSLANWQSIGTVHSTFAPVSTKMNGPSAEGITAPSAGRLTPLIRLTINVAPTSSAPVLPAEINASPLPSASACKPTAIDVFFPAFKISVGWVSIWKTSSACKSSKAPISSPFSAAQA